MHGCCMNSSTAQDPSVADRSRPRSLSDSFILAGLGAFIALAGAVFTGVLWHGYQIAAETHRWQPHSCFILSSQVITERQTPHSPLSYRASILYRYFIDGKAYNGKRIRWADGDTNHEESADALVTAYPTGSNATCYVNPQHPENALLRQSPRAPLYSIWFPLLFVLGGGGMIWKAWRKAK